MGRIPTIVSKLTATEAGTVDVTASGRQFNAASPAIGAALSQAGSEIFSASAGLAREQQEELKRTQAEELSNRVAQSDLTSISLDAQSKAAADGAGLAESTTTAMRNYVTERANEIKDPVVRKRYTTTMETRIAAYRSNATEMEFKLRGENSQREANNSMNSLLNQIRSDPGAYDTVVKDGANVIAARPDIPAPVRARMADAWAAEAAGARFEGALGAAKSPEDFDRLEAELKTPQWQSRLDPKRFESVADRIATVRKAFVTKADSDARAAIETLEKRNNDLTPIPQRELDEVGKAVGLSQNPVTAVRYQRLRREQDILSSEGKAPPSVLRDKIAAVRNADGYVDFVPASVSSAVNDAVRLTGGAVSASYLAGVSRTVNSSTAGVSPRLSSTQQAVATQLVQAAGSAGLPARAVALMGWQESKFNPNTRPYAGGRLLSSAVGVGQILKAEYNKYGVYAGPGSTVENQITAFVAKTKDNVAAARSALGRDPTPGELYVVHYQGIGAGPEILKNPDASFIGTLANPKFGGWGYAARVIAANPWLAGIRTNRDFIEWSTNKMNAAERRVFGGEGVVPGERAAGGARSATANVPAEPRQVFDFDDKTWTNVVKGAAARFGINIDGKSDEEIIAMKGDDVVRAKAVAAYAESNKKYLQSELGRNVDDGEVYIAQLFGPNRAVEILQTAKDNPTMKVRELPDFDAKNFAGLFDPKRDKDITVEQLAKRAQVAFSTTQSAVVHADQTYRQRMLDQREKALKADPVAEAVRSGTHSVVPLSDPGGMAARGAAVRSIADYYSIPTSDVKPFTENESAELSKRIKEGNADEVLALMTEVQSMGGDLAKAAYKQLGEKDPVFAYAAGLAADTPESKSVAADIVRGQKRLEEDKTILQAFGTKRDEAETEFYKIAGNTLTGASPGTTTAIMNAAIAHFVETQSVLGATKNALDTAAFKSSVQKVLGREIGEVNGAPTILPKGVDEDTLNEAIDKMTMQEWTSMSVSGLPPRHSDGRMVDPLDIATQGRLSAIGGDQYRIVMPDGVLTTGRSDGKRVEAYVFKPDAELIKSVAMRPDVMPAPPRAKPTPDEPPPAPPVGDGPQNDVNTEGVEMNRKRGGVPRDPLSGMIPGAR